MRLYYRVGKDFVAAAQGEKSEGQGSFGILSRFARSKLAPIPSFFVDMLSRKDFIGRDFEYSRAIVERVAPDSSITRDTNHSADLSRKQRLKPCAVG